VKCECGNDRFYGRQHRVYIDDWPVIVNENGHFLYNEFDFNEEWICASGEPYGPFKCTKCGKEYELLIKERW
jgi:hypothetical protein